MSRLDQKDACGAWTTSAVSSGVTRSEIMELTPAFTLPPPES